MESSETCIKSSWSRWTRTTSATEVRVHVSFKNVSFSLQRTSAALFIFMRSSDADYTFSACLSFCLFVDKHFWVQGYTLISQDAEDCVPVFLRHIANDVYVCGKTINLLKICCPQVWRSKYNNTLCCRNKALLIPHHPASCELIMTARLWQPGKTRHMRTFFDPIVLVVKVVFKSAVLPEVNSKKRFKRCHSDSSARATGYTFVFFSVQLNQHMEFTAWGNDTRI